MKVKPFDIVCNCEYIQHHLHFVKAYKSTSVELMELFVTFCNPVKISESEFQFKSYYIAYGYAIFNLNKFNLHNF